MPFNRFQKDMAIVAALDDEPNDVGGLTAGELKEKFDEGGQALKGYLNNTLLPDLEGEAAAGMLGATPFGKVTGTDVQTQLRQVADSVEQVALGQIPDGSIGAQQLANKAIGPEKLMDHSIGPDKLVGALQSYYFVFEAEDWDGETCQLRVPRAVHRLPTGLGICARTLHMRIKRSARDYDDAGAAQAKAKLVALQAAALAANAASPGTYPVAEDGHVELTWEQVQYYLLEEVLASAGLAASKAVELGFDWKNIHSLNVPETVSLDQLLAATYLPALGGNSNALDALWSVEVLQGLRFRAAVPGQEGVAKKYDLFGWMSGHTWGVYESDVRLDRETGDLVLSASAPYAGELLVIASPGAA